MPTQDKSKDTQEAILEIAKKRFQLAVDAEAQSRTEELDDLQFLAGNQWPEDVRKDREADNRPCLTINRLPQFVRQVTNDQRQNRPSINVSPVDSGADVDTAKIFQGIIRHIEQNSNADVAYDTAAEGAAGRGIGYFRLTTDYVDETSFEQEIFIKRIRNRFSVYLDPHYQEPDASDANWGFIFEDLSVDDYKAQYPNSQLASMDDWQSIGDQIPDWVNAETVRVAEYFYREYEESEILLLVDGSTLALKDVPKGKEIPKEAIKSRRKVSVCTIKWCKLNAVEILDETEWPGKWIPIIPVIGDELDINGRVTRSGIIRHAKDPQRMYNIWASAETETIGMAPRAPFIGAAGQFDGFAEQWRTANTRSHAFLEYNPKNVNGQPVGPPQRNVYEPPVQAITNARMQSSEDLKATTGIYDASLGARSNENSGVAIQRRNMQAQTNNFHYIDNLSRAMRHCGRQIVDLIPKIYDTARSVRIIGEDGETDMARVNQIFTEGGQEKSYWLGQGRYDVTISTGPSYATKRQEAVASMLDMSKVAPQLMQVAGDLLVKNMDWPGAQDIADRLKKTLPPGVADDKKDQAPIPPQVQAQLQQMGQMIQNLTGALNQAHDQLDGKRMELESRERIAFAQIEADITKTMATIDQKDALELMKQEIAVIKHQQQLDHSQSQFESKSAQDAAALAAQTQPTGGSSPGTPVESNP